MFLFSAYFDELTYHLHFSIFVYNFKQFEN